MTVVGKKDSMRRKNGMSWQECRPAKDKIKEILISMGAANLEAFLLVSHR